MVSQYSLMVVRCLVAGTAVHGATPAAALAQDQDPRLGIYLEQVDREWPGESHQQSITTRSLSLLADAIASLANRRGLHTDRLRDALEKARGLARDFDAHAPSRPDQTDRLRRTLLAYADIIDQLLSAAGLEKEPVDPRLSALRRAADSLDTSLSPRRQPDVIERFFEHAGGALRRLETCC